MSFSEEEQTNRVLVGLGDRTPFNVQSLCLRLKTRNGCTITDYGDRGGQSHESVNPDPEIQETGDRHCGQAVVQGGQPTCCTASQGYTQALAPMELTELDNVL